MSSSGKDEKNKPLSNSWIQRVEKGVIKGFSARKHNFQALYDRLRKENPDLAFYIMRRAEQIAPRDVKMKEKLLRIALELHALQVAQREVEQLRKLFRKKKKD